MMKAAGIARYTRIPLIRVGFSYGKASFHSNARRLHLQDQFPNLNPEQMEKLMQNSLVLKVAKSPKALGALQDMVKMLNDKGYLGDMGVMKQIKILMDGEVKREFQKVKQVLDEEGIELKKDDIMGMTELMKMGPDNK